MNKHQLSVYLLFNAVLGSIVQPVAGTDQDTINLAWEGTVHAATDARHLDKCSVGSWGSLGLKRATEHLSHFNAHQAFLQTGKFGKD